MIRALAAKPMPRLTPRGFAMASVALFGVAVQIGWLVMLAEGAASVAAWLL
jgi:hypothetical protein